MGLVTILLPPLLWSVFSNLPAWQALPASEQLLCIGKQSALVIAIYGIKPLYMLLALAALGLTWGEKGVTWRTLQASLVSFWVGEFFCWLNILLFADEALLLEYLHSVFMVFCLGLLFYCIIQAVDNSLLHYTDPRARCALTGICKNCIKAQPDVPGACLLHRFFQWMVPLVAVIALMPLMAPPFNFSFVTKVFGFQRTLNHLMPIQWYELRFCPVAAMVLMLISWLVLLWPAKTLSQMLSRLSISKILISASVGLLSFSLMRLAFAAFYRELLVWFVGWEELTELLLIISIVVVVWLIRPEKFGRWKTKLLELST